MSAELGPEHFAQLKGCWTRLGEPVDQLAGKLDPDALLWD